MYNGGNIIFTPDGTSVISPVGNKITVFDLANHTSVTMPFENQGNIQRIALSPIGNILLSIDVGMLVGFVLCIYLHTSRWTCIAGKLQTQSGSCTH